MGGQQIEIGQSLDSCLAFGGIAHRMVKDIPEGIHPCLVSPAVHLGLGQHRAVRCQNPAPHDAVRKAVQPCVVGVVDYILALYLEEISQIGCQPQEQGHHHIGDAQNAAVGF